MKIKDAVEEYLATKQNSITAKTYRWYDDFLAKFLVWCEEQDPRLTELDKITATHVQYFVGSNPGESTYTRHHRAQIVKGFLNWCSKDEEMGVRPRMVSRIEMPKVIESEVEIFDPEDIKKLFRACDRMKHPHRNRALLHLLLDTGIRASELCVDSNRPQEQTGLQMDCLVLGRGTESYIRVMGKGRKSRTIGLGNESTICIRKYLNRERVGDSPYVFLSSHGDGEPLSVRMLQQFLDQLGELAGVPDCHAHRFRHTFAVSQLMAGTSDLVLMKLLGHTTLDSTKIYTRAMTQIQARLSAISVVDTIKNAANKFKRNK